MPSPPDSPSTFPRLVGRAVERVEDAALLTGRGRFADDVGERPGTAHAAVLRSPHAHAEIVSLDATAALSMPEVVTVLTGAEVAAWSRPFIAGVKQPMRHYAFAVDRVRYTGEPVAVVVARDRYAAEDALERIEVEYRELDPVVDPVAAAAPGAPLLHRDVGSNVVSDRRLRYGDPDAAFASAASGSRLDSGDYRAALDTATAGGRLDRLRARRGAARAAGRRYGIGFAAVVEPSISNMGYITMALTAGERARVGPKDGAAASATVSIDPLGSIAAHVASVPQGQGHRTVLAQVIAGVLGVELDDVTVNVEHDTQKDPWSIAAGNYSSRFSGAVAGAAHLAAMKLRERLARIASTGLNATPEALVFAGGRIFAADNPENAIPLRRAAGIAHWSPGSLPEHAEPGLRETIFWSMPGLDPPDEDDRVNSSGAYGFIFDMCGVEVDDTGRVRIDEYVTMHDAGTRLNPALVDGQIRGGFAHGVGAALYEELAYAGDGSFLSGTFADYLVPTACEVPAPTILHMESPSPFTPLGAKGVGEGNTMSTPVCLANAVADALDFDDVELPMTPSKVASWLAGEEPLPPSGACGPGAITEVGVAQVEAGSTTPSTPEVEDERSSKGPARVTAPPEPAAPGSTVLDSEKLSADGPDAITGAGEVRIGVAPAALWPILLDAERLARVIPGCKSLVAKDGHCYEGDVSAGIGPVRGRFRASVVLSDLDPPRGLSFLGTSQGPLGSSTGSGALVLEPDGSGTLVRYTCRYRVTGKIAAIGARMLEGMCDTVDVYPTCRGTPDARGTPLDLDVTHGPSSSRKWQASKAGDIERRGGVSPPIRSRSRRGPLVLYRTQSKRWRREVPSAGFPAQ